MGTLVLVTSPYDYYHIHTSWQTLGLPNLLEGPGRWLLLYGHSYA